ncbi:monocarboxylate transporter 12-like isoform X2 [Littorina saxatilis]|uniref:monocarboxylate transporter 12-like isoform X2 n=1 Tax=Littorina saxatilis TaxID=31220 RepID=UPI0038B4D1D9
MECANGTEHSRILGGPGLIPPADKPEDECSIMNKEETQFMNGDDVPNLESKPDVTHVEKQDGVPRDGGWGWVVVFGTFFNYVLLSGYIKSSGLFFVELLQKFHAPATQTTLLFAVRAATYSIAGFYVMNVCLDRFGARKLILIGGSLMSLSAILSSLANELASLICLQSILLAMGHAMLISPGQVLVGQYFDKRRSLALSISELGVSIGNFVIPPLISFLLQQYALSGTLLLYGGICLNSLPAAILHRPTSYFAKRHLRQLRHRREDEERDVEDLIQKDRNPSVEETAAGTDDKKRGGKSKQRCSSGRSLVKRVIDCPKAFILLIDLSLFRSPVFCLFMLYVTVSNIVSVPVDYLPALVGQNDVTESQAAQLLSIIGGLDLLCRVACCGVTYSGMLSASTLTLVSYVILAIVMQFVGFMTSFEHFVALAVVQGLMGSVGQCLFPVLVIEFVGVERMAKCIGFSQLVAGASMAGIYPLLGYIRDITGSYTAVYHVIGAGMLLSAIFLAFERPIRRLETKQQQRYNQSVTVEDQDTYHIQQ